MQAVGGAIIVVIASWIMGAIVMFHIEPELRTAARNRLRRLRG
jgi:uncharacterized integral membrane protein